MKSFQIFYMKKKSQQIKGNDFFKRKPPLSTSLAIPIFYKKRIPFVGFKGFHKFVRRVMYLIIHTRNSFYFFVAIKIFMNYVFFVNFAKTQNSGNL